MSKQIIIIKFILILFTILQIKNVNALPINSNYDVVCENVFNDIEKIFFEPPYPVKWNGKWGYIDSDCRIVINNIFDKAWGFLERNQNYANVFLGGLNGKWGLINRSGNFHLNPVYDEPIYSNGNYGSFFSVVINKKRLMLDSSGNIVDYSYAKNIIDKTSEADNNFYSIGRSGSYPNYHIAKLNKYYRTLEIINGENFEDVGFFSEGKISVNKSEDGIDKWGFADASGKIVIRPQFDAAGTFNDGLCSIRIGDNRTGKWGAINHQGVLVISPQFEQNFYFDKGYAVVKINNKYGVIKNNGTYIINPIFDEWKLISKTRQSFVKYNGYWSLIQLKF